MQSTLYRPPRTLPHLAAVMDTASLARLPRLAGACIDLGIATLSVCTQPPDLRLAASREASAMLDALADALAALDDTRLSLIGRRYYLPARLAALVEQAAQGPGRLHLRMAVDYAGKASILGHGGELPPAPLLLLPDGREPGNLLRWHYAHAARIRVDWPSFDAEGLEALLDDLPPRFDRRFSALA